jgi:hypothetical protein
MRKKRPSNPDPTSERSKRFNSLVLQLELAL